MLSWAARGAGIGLVGGGAFGGASQGPSGAVTGGLALGGLLGTAGYLAGRKRQNLLRASQNLSRPAGLPISPVSPALAAPRVTTPAATTATRTASRALSRGGYFKFGALGALAGLGMGAMADEGAYRRRATGGLAAGIGGRYLYNQYINAGGIGGIGRSLGMKPSLKSIAKSIPRNIDQSARKVAFNFLGNQQSTKLLSRAGASKIWSGIRSMPRGRLGMLAAAGAATYMGLGAMIRSTRPVNPIPVAHNAAVAY